jgi:hypothetical protein
VPRGGVKNLSDFKSLACPTVAKGPIVFQCLFLRLSHRLLASRHVRFTPESGHQADIPQCPLCANSGHSALQ